jgi:dTMP kinase
LPILHNHGVLVAVEGIDGAGKTTQVGLLARSLQAVGLDTIVSKEPTTGYWGQRIRSSARNGRLSLDDELRILINDRSEHVRDLIQPALDSGKIVILDRYFYSTIAYQGSRGANLASLQAEMETRFPIPDAVFLLDLDPVVGVSRIRNSRKEVPNEFERVDVLEQVREIFNSLLGPIVPIDGCMPVDQVHRRVLESFVNGPLKAKRPRAWEELSPRLLAESPQEVGEF